MHVAVRKGKYNWLSDLMTVPDIPSSVVQFYHHVVAPSLRGRTTASKLAEPSAREASTRRDPFVSSVGAKTSACG